MKNESFMLAIFFKIFSMPKEKMKKIRPRTLYVDYNYVMNELFFSDDFIAQQQSPRWASEDVVSVVVMESDSSAVDPSPVTVTQNIISQMGTVTQNGLGAIVSRTDYYQSPPSTTETESSGSVMVTQRRGIDVVNGGQQQENTGRFLEYKH